jgi:L-threonylcarbamoyladenylate synthase
LALVLPADSLQIYEEGSRTIHSGGLVAFPTDTVYGIGASVHRPSAVGRLYDVKGRPLNKPIALLLASAGEMEEVAQDIPEIAWRLAQRFWPGALTMVLPGREDLPEIVSAGQGTVAVRVPAHPVALALIAAAGIPLATTSANLSTHPPALTAQEVVGTLGKALDLIIDGGRAPGGTPSTVLDLTLDQPTILRLGALSARELEGVLEGLPLMSPSSP